MTTNDSGVIRLGRDIDSVGQFGMQYNADWAGTRFRTTGYPSDKGITQRFSDANVTADNMQANDDPRLVHSADIIKGQSGSPLYTQGNFVFGIQSSEGTYNGARCNFATKLTQYQFNFIYAAANY